MGTRLAGFGPARWSRESAPGACAWPLRPVRRVHVARPATSRPFVSRVGWKSMPDRSPIALVDRVRDAAQLLAGDGATDYDALLDKVGDARFVLIGEASHGTHEFYAERAAITR